AILFILVYFAVKAFFDESKKAIIISLAFCFLFACSDEIHQLFVPGRAFEFADIMIDTSGAVLAALICFVFEKHFTIRISNDKKVNQG
ncbi:MAG: VanZ family protein, partial [Lachnospiraceae bacterium]|nr:VanZ family protein [Lachnospiraceae bacterium]